MNVASIEDQLRGLLRFLEAGTLRGSDIEFARSLLQQAHHKGLSPNQAAWVGRLVERYSEGAQS